MQVTKRYTLKRLSIVATATLVIGLGAGLAEVTVPPPSSASATAGDITLAGFGQRVVPSGTNGDTWDSTWLSNGNVLMQQNDGSGFDGSTSPHARIVNVTGDPNTPSTLGGSNLNPGSLGSTLPNNYSSTVYQVDGALYIIQNYSNQVGGDFTFNNAGLLKSTDGGANWVNIEGGTNAMTANDQADSTFPSTLWGSVNFVKYGEGGTAPDVDNAQTYVYLSDADGSNAQSANYYLARVKRSDLEAWTTTFDKTKIEYYIGGDGSSDSAWSTDINDAVSIYNNPGRVSPTDIVYNSALGRYIATPFNSDAFASPNIPSAIRVMQAPHPWGPWTDVLDENMEAKQGDNLTWSFLTQKYTSSDGEEMWMTAAGQDPYGLQFVPVYLSTQPAQTLEAENAQVTGGSVSTSTPGYSGTGYVTGLDATGDSVQFHPTVSDSGAYIINLRFHTTATRTLSWQVNGRPQGEVPIADSTTGYSTWTTVSLFAWLNAGSNDLSFQVNSGDSGNVDIDDLKLALYSTTANAIPGVGPVGPNVDDTSSAVTYTGSWLANGTTSTGYYDDTMHYTDTAGDYAQYTFSGPSVQFYGAKNSNNGDDDIYVDGVLKGTIDRYSPTYDKQQLLFSASGLGSGTHTLKIVADSTKDSASSGYYTDVDGFFLPPAPTIDDTSTSVTYTGSGWAANGTTSTGYYDNTMHYTNEAGDYATFSFSGTSVAYFGATNSDNGEDDIYVDGTFEGTIDRYSPTYIKQVDLFSISGLAPGSHTLKIVVDSTHNPSSSNYYTDVDAFFVG